MWDCFLLVCCIKYSTVCQTAEQTTQAVWKPNLRQNPTTWSAEEKSAPSFHHWFSRTLWPYDAIWAELSWHSWRGSAQHCHIELVLLPGSGMEHKVRVNLTWTLWSNLKISLVKSSSDLPSNMPTETKCGQELQEGNGLHHSQRLPDRDGWGRDPSIYAVCIEWAQKLI